MDLSGLLLVDDEKDFVETLASRLRERGFAVECVFSGIEALARLKKDTTIDVVLLDVGMPFMDGIMALEILKKKYPLIEVIMLTGHAAVQSAIEAIKLGAFDYLTKPCDLNDLIFKAEKAGARKKKREAEILDVRMKPYITQHERQEMISGILDRKD